MFDNQVEGSLGAVEAQMTRDDSRPVPRTHVKEQDQRYLVEALLPGVRQEDIALSMRGCVLSFSAELPF